MGQKYTGTTYVATTVAGDYLQFYDRGHAVLAVEGYASRRGLKGCRWTAGGDFLGPDGRKLGRVGILGGTDKGSQVLYHRGCGDASSVANQDRSTSNECEQYPQPPA